MLSDPTKETNLESLKKHVKDANADYGVAFDGDGDRTVQAKIVFDVKCTMNLKKSILESKGIPIECRTGHSYIKNMIKQEKSNVRR